MSTTLPSGDGFTDFVTLDFDDRGNLLEPSTKTVVPTEGVEAFLTRQIRVPADTTDIFVFVHGWNTAPRNAQGYGRRLFGAIETISAAHPERYPGLTAFRGYYVLVRWPSSSSPLPWGYRKIRNRAHAMTTHGHAEFVLAGLLGYLNAERRVPVPGPPVLGTRDGQYLHLVGHSFGGRFLGEALKEAADPQGPPVLPLLPPDPRYPWAVDSMLVFQMAARPDVFTGDFADLLVDAPIQGPITLTFSRFDRANRLWHRIAEGAPGIGAVGARTPADQVRGVRLLRPDEAYDVEQLRSRILNVDAGRVYRRGRLLPPGAHSDFWYEESIHLLLTVASHARP